MQRPENSEAAQFNSELGLAYLQQGQNERAKAKLLLALQQNARDSLTVCAFAYYLDHTGETAAAAKYYAYALRLDNSSGAVHNNYGVFLCRHGNYQQAIEQFLVAAHDLGYLHTAAAYSNAAACAAKIPDRKHAQHYLALARQRDSIHSFRVKTLES